jgi:hypothetical protein
MCLSFYIAHWAEKEVTLNGLIIRTSTPFLLFIVLHGLITGSIGLAANSGLSYLPIYVIHNHTNLDDYS